MAKKLNNLEDYIKSSLQNISYFLDSSKVMGKPIEINSETIVVPITKVTFGFGTGGSEFGSPTIVQNSLSYEIDSDLYPYGGRSVGGFAIRPEAFLIISKKEAKIVKMDEKNIYNKVLDMVIVALKNRKKGK